MDVDTKYKRWGWGAVIGLIGLILVAGLIIAVTMSATPKPEVASDTTKADSTSAQIDGEGSGSENGGSNTGENSENGNGGQNGENSENGSQNAENNEGSSDNYGYEAFRPDVMQPGYGRDSKRSDHPGNRRARRGIRNNYRQCHPPVQNVEQVKGACNVEPPRSMR